MSSGRRAKRARRHEARSHQHQPGEVSFGWTVEGDVEVVVHGVTTISRRIVPAARPLDPALTKGKSAELASMDAAAVWGMPDYVFKPTVVRTGSGPREVSDFILVTGRVGLLLQVKSRAEPGVRAEREELWAYKQSAAAVRQAKGSLRMLRREPSLHTNLRGQQLTIGYDDVQRWVIVVLIDHERPPIGTDLSAHLPASADPIVVLTRRDWQFLWDQLKSGTAVASYLARVADDEMECGLGQEAARYYRLAAEDALAPQISIESAEHLYGDPRHWSGPELPQEPAGHGERQGFATLRLVQEDVAQTAFEETHSPPDAEAVRARLRMLWALDDVSVVHRRQLGADLLAWLRDAKSAPEEELRWRARRMVGHVGTPLLGFAVASRLDPAVRNVFENWALLAHHQNCARSASTLAETMCVLLVPHSDLVDRWDSVCLFTEGPSHLLEHDAARLQAVFEAGVDGRPLPPIAG